jgi:soluble lytic murein transglycosylase-like protein
LAGHRSPDGRRVRVAVRSAPARHRSADAPAPTGPSLRTAVLATAAAVGAVATGTFTALVPTPAAGTAPSAAADEALVTTTLAANATTAMTLTPAHSGSMAALLPVSAMSDGGDGFAAADQHLALLDKAATLAQKLADEQADRRTADAAVGRGGLDGWIAQALQVLDMPQSYSPGLKKIILAESGGNPHAINTWDSNARRGTPSRGLMQTIPSTYRHYVHPDLADRPITDPVANITAGTRYMIDNYGIGTLQAGGRKGMAGGYVGY